MDKQAQDGYAAGAVAGNAPASPPVQAHPILAGRGGGAGRVRLRHPAPGMTLRGIPSQWKGGRPCRHIFNHHGQLRLRLSHTGMHFEA